MDGLTRHAERDSGRTCPNPNPRPSPEDITLLLHWNTLHLGFRRLIDELVADVEAKACVDPASFCVLRFLLTAPEQTARMQELTQALGFSTAGTTKVADRLAEAGLLERRPSPTDRRVIYATLTPTGMEVGTTAVLALAGSLRARVIPTLGVEGFENLASAISALSTLDPNPGSTC
jgi:DNA-binding MarR family transcriptional regulator